MGLELVGGGAGRPLNRRERYAVEDTATVRTAQSNRPASRTRTRAPFAPTLTTVALSPEQSPSRPTRSPVREPATPGTRTVNQVRP